MIKDSNPDRLIAESERLRKELLKTAVSLEFFSQQLLEEVRALREAAWPDLERNDDGPGTRNE
jgi:hypothetical protein